MMGPFVHEKPPSESPSKSLSQTGSDTGLKQSGLPIERLSPVGDSSYGGKLLMLSRLKKNYRPRRDGREKPLLDRTSLHYKKLQFDHPFSKEKVTIESELPKDMCVALKYLRKYASGLGLEN